MKIFTSALGFISNILSFITSVLYFPIVFVVAIICLFIFVTSILSLSINTKFETPALASASTTNEPTPPIPNIAIFAFFSLSIPSVPISSSVLENLSSLFSLYKKHSSSCECITPTACKYE